MAIPYDATVLARSVKMPYGESGNQFEIVLRYDATQFLPFFTHECVYGAEGVIYHSNGGYFETAEEGVADFGKRTLTELRRQVKKTQQDEKLLRAVEMVGK